MGVGPRELVVEFGQPGAVFGPGPLVQDRVGAERCHRHGRPAVTTGGQLGRGHFPAGGGEQDGQVAQALRVPQLRAPAGENEGPDLAVAAELAGFAVPVSLVTRRRQAREFGSRPVAMRPGTQPVRPRGRVLKVPRCVVPRPRVSAAA
jgi:hypothetical protein